MVPWSVLEQLPYESGAPSVGEHAILVRHLGWPRLSPVPQLDGKADTVLGI